MISLIDLLIFPFPISTKVPTIILTWECKKDFAATSIIILFSFSITLIVSIVFKEELAWQSIDLKASKLCFPIKNLDSYTTLSISIFLNTPQDLLWSIVKGALLFVMMYWYILLIAENLAWKFSSTFWAFKTAIGWGLKCWFNPSLIFSTSNFLFSSKWATWPNAWTPASVLPATINFILVL